MSFKSSSTFNMGISQCGAKGYIIDTGEGL